MVLFPALPGDFFLLHNFRTDSEAHAVGYKIDNRWFYFTVKKAVGA
jgi:hypothetical protein